MNLDIKIIKKIIKESIKEDIEKGDITTDRLLKRKIADAKIIAKEPCILCGIEIAKEVFKIISKQKICFLFSKKDGEEIEQDQIVLEMKGNIKHILKGERVALNFLGHLCGIATITKKYVQIAKKYNVQILDTRKTLPNLRILQKYATRIGGAQNHRFNLSEMPLVKDNHLKFASIPQVVKKLGVDIEIEIENFSQLKEVVVLNIKRIMLDNINDLNLLAKMIKYIRENAKDTKIEVSGGINLDNIEDIAKLKPDFISIGQITHSAKSIDFSLEFL